MAVLIDQAHWPAHGTRFAHLASDVSLAELHDFARAHGVPARAFDHDHYDIAESRVAELVDAGALPVAPRELARRLSAAGLRVRANHRVPSRHRARAQLDAAWQAFSPHHPELGAELIARWEEPHRHYHDTRHLSQMLGALHTLYSGPPPVTVQYAAWFHDAVYAGTAAGVDEAASATLAEARLRAVGLPSDLVSEVSRLVLLTAVHQPTADDTDGWALVDADLSILGQIPGRYQMYVRGVRLEHAALSDQQFGLARLGVLRALLATELLYGTASAQQLWLDQARHNLHDEIDRWQVVVGPDAL